MFEQKQRVRDLVALALLDQLPAAASCATP
jgi:hypothetical protein